MAGISSTYISATSFSVVGDQTSTFNIGRRIRATCSSVYKYGTIESSAYTTLTTVVLTATSDDLNSGLTEVYYGIAADSIGSLPTHAHDATEGEGGALTLVSLSDTPATYDNAKYLQSTSSGTQWSSISASHADLSNLAYDVSGHTGFSPTIHSHTESDISDLDKYTQSEVDTISGSLSSEIDSDIATHTSNSDAHHSESHTVASHSDTTASGADLNELVGSGDTTLHKHDTLYYTEAEVDTISGSLQTNIDGKSDTGHTHDDRYYTESEIDTISGSLQTNIDGKSDTGHTHDDRYYTETEIDTWRNSTTQTEMGYVHGVTSDIQDQFDAKPDVEVFLTEGAPSDAIGDSGDIAIDQDVGTVYKKSDPVADSGIFYPVVGADDGNWNEYDHWYPTNINVMIGRMFSSVGCTAWIRCPNITIPEGSTITSAYARLTANSNASDTVYVKFYLNDVDDAVAPINVAQGKALVLTSAVVPWTVPTFTTHSKYNSPSLVSILQEVIDRSGWSSGNAVQIVIKDNGTPANYDFRYVAALEDADDDCVEFHIEWDTPPTWEEKLSPDFIKLSDTPTTYSGVDGKFLKTTTTGIEFSNDEIYTESEVDTISGSLQTNIDADKPADEVVVELINTPTFDSIQDWFNNTQSAGRMGGGDTTSHTDAITGVTVSGAGSGEFKVSGDQTAYFPAALSIHITGSTNNNGYFTVSSGTTHSGGTTTIPVDETVSSGIDGNIYNGRVDVSAGTGILKVTDSDIGLTKSFDISADTNIELTDITTNYIYVDYNAGTPDIKVTTDRDSIEYNRQFPLGMIYRNGPRTWSCSCGINLPNYTRLNHERLLNTRGYERASGGEISEAGTRNIESTAGIFYRGSDRVDTTAKASVTDKLTTVYYDGSGWVWTEDLTQIDNTYYNNIASGLIELTASRYGVHWVCIDYLSNLYVVYGRGNYTLAQAQLAGVPSLMPVVAVNFGIVAAKIIIQKASASFEEIISAYTQLIPSSTPTTHNDLSGLNDGDYKHLTASEYSSAILDRAVPGNIGGTTPAEGTFTILTSTTASGVILTAPDSSEWYLCVSDSGVLSTAAV